MSASEPCSSLTADGVDFVDEDDTGLVPLSHIEQVAHTRSADADVHFHEVGTADGEKRNARFTRNRLRKQGFTCSGRAYEQNALGDLRPQIGELLGIFEEFHNLFELFLLLFRSRDIREPHFQVGRDPRLCLAEVHHLPPASAHRSEYKEEGYDANDKNRNIEKVPPSAARIGIVELDNDPVFDPLLQIGRAGIELARTDGTIRIAAAGSRRITVQVIPADFNSYNFISLARLGIAVAEFEEFVKRPRPLRVDLRVNEEIYPDSHDSNEQDDNDGFDYLTQMHISFL